MVQINFALKEVNCKIVYYGPGMSGKTTNLEVVHKKAPTANKGELTSIATEGDRTLFFDFMPLDLGNIAGMRTKFQLYTVPGQVYYNSTRKLVLQGVDGIIFVADSQEGKMDENLESMENLRNNLAEYGKVLEDIPMVLQYNKRDLGSVMDAEYMNERLNPRGLTCFEAVATTGEGVFPTLKALSAMVLESLSREKRTGGITQRRRIVSSVNQGGGDGERETAGTSTATALSPGRTREASVPEPSPRMPEPSPRAPDEALVASREPHRKPDASGAPGGIAPPLSSERTARSRAPAGRLSAPPEEKPSGLKIRKGADAYRAAFSPSNEAPDEPRGPASQDTAPAALRTGNTRNGPRSSERSQTPGRGKAQSPLVQKFVLEDESGSPLILIALTIIILIAAGVILYSFKVI